MPMLRKRRTADAANKPVVRRQFRRYGGRSRSRLCGAARGAPRGDENRLRRPWCAPEGAENASGKRQECARKAKRALVDPPAPLMPFFFVIGRPLGWPLVARTGNQAARVHLSPQPRPPEAPCRCPMRLARLYGLLPQGALGLSLRQISRCGQADGLACRRVSACARRRACVAVCKRLRWCSAVKPPRPASSASRRSPRRARSTRPPSRRAVLRCA